MNVEEVYEKSDDYLESLSYRDPMESMYIV